eukprot:12229931-Karenia_brevis.AAC.1
MANFTQSANAGYEEDSYFTYGSEVARGVLRTWPKAKIMNEIHRKNCPPDDGNEPMDDFLEARICQDGFH